MRYLEGNELSRAITYCNEAAALARRSKCIQAQHGVVIVSDDVIIGRGRNTPVPDEPCDPCTRKDVKGISIEDMCHSVHAEENAFIDALKNGYSIEGACAYHAGLDDSGNIRRDNIPLCTKCSRLLRQQGLGFFVLIDDKGYALYDIVEFDELSYANRKKKLMGSDV